MPKNTIYYFFSWPKRALIESGEDRYQQILQVWQDMEQHPENFFGPAYSQEFLQPMYQWVIKS